MLQQSQSIALITPGHDHSSLMKTTLRHTGPRCTHFHYKEHGHASECQMFSHFHYPLAVSTTLIQCWYINAFLLRWYYVNPVFTTLSLGN